MNPNNDCPFGMLSSRKESPQFWAIIDAQFTRAQQLAFSLWADELERLTIKKWRA